MGVRIALISGVLLLSHGALLTPPQAAGQAEHASPAKAAKAPVPKISVTPTGMLADINGNSAEDLTLHYSIDGDLSQVSKAWVEITDGPHGKVLFTQPVPVQSTGEVIWPRGQPMETTPNEISFQVWNSGDAVSTTVQADAEYPLPEDDPTPILSSITPRRVVEGTKDALIVLRGRNFIPKVMVAFSNPETVLSHRHRGFESRVRSAPASQSHPSLFMKNSGYELVLLTNRELVDGTRWKTRFAQDET